MPLPTLGSVAQRMYNILVPLHKQDEREDYDLATFVGGLGLSMQELEDLAVDPSGEVGWSKLFDPQEIPAEGLPWLAQLIGVRLAAGLTEQQQRDAIEGRLGWERGTRSAMAIAASLFLTGTKTVIFRERYPTPYSISVLTRTGETPTPALTEAAIRAQKPAGLILTYSVLIGQDYQELLDTHATYQLVFTDYATYQELIEDT